MKLTDNFSLEEFVISETATRAGIDDTPPADVMMNLQILAQGLERIRGLLGHPIHISSGYRSPRLNQMIGGSKTSAHMQGLAADFICPGFGSPLEVCRRIAKDNALIVPDQIIHEFGRWCHIGFAKPGQMARNELLTISSALKGYELGLNQVVA